MPRFKDQSLPEGLYLWRITETVDELRKCVDFGALSAADRVLLGFPGGFSGGSSCNSGGSDGSSEGSGDSRGASRMSDGRLRERLAVRALLQSLQVGDGLVLEYTLIRVIGDDGVMTDGVEVSVPFVEGYAISISHTAHWTGIYLLPIGGGGSLKTCGRVGVDIELLSRDASRVVGRVTGDAEQAIAEQIWGGGGGSSGEGRAALFLWCAKEAMYKAAFSGFSIADSVSNLGRESGIGSGMSTGTVVGYGCRVPGFKRDLEVLPLGVGRIFDDTVSLKAVVVEDIMVVLCK